MASGRDEILLRAPTIFETTPEHVVALDIAFCRQVVKASKGGMSIAGHALTFQKHPAEPKLSRSYAAFGGGLDPLRSAVALQSLRQFFGAHHGQRRHAPGFMCAQRRHGSPHLRTKL